MTKSRQAVLSLALIASAAVVVTAYLLSDGSPGPDSPESHAVHGTAASGDEQPVRLSAENAGRIGVTYATAEYGPLLSKIRTVGQVTYDETRVSTVNPKIEGWVEELFVDFTGASVVKGQPLLAVYSPVLVAAQEELILARRLSDRAGISGTTANNARELLEAARRRLSYWDIPASDIERIESSGQTRKTLMLRSPATGLVLEKNVLSGGRIMPGMDLYRIADLSVVWIDAEIFEKDLARVGIGRTGTITLEAYPDRRFPARVSYTYPTVSAETRTGRVRVEVRNPGLLFKPGMYATLEFDVPVHDAGVHVPRSAVLQTGTRSLVFVRDPDGTLTPRTVRIGFVTSEHAEVLEGLKAGDVVVASANFLIDAESNLGSALQALPGGATAQPAPVTTSHKH
ncbi:MAG: efflux RND transporter periplasmic adaptor subunit [Gemmatimonadota bacterium]